MMLLLTTPIALVAASSKAHLTGKKHCAMFSRDVSTAVETECNQSCLLVDKPALEKE